MQSMNFPGRHRLIECTHVCPAYIVYFWTSSLFRDLTALAGQASHGREPIVKLGREHFGTLFFSSTPLREAVLQSTINEGVFLFVLSYCELSLFLFAVYNFRVCDS